MLTTSPTKPVPRRTPFTTRAPGPPLRNELRAVHALVLRDIMQLAASPVYALLLLLQPLLYLLALGGGLSGLVPDEAVGSSYRTFVFPGVLLMSIQAPALNNGIRLITDRSTGTLRETLMAPARRTTLLCGMCLGACITATIQGGTLLAFAPAAGLPYRPTLMLSLLAQLALAAFTLTALGTALAVYTRKMETFSLTLTLTSAPLLFLSGSFVPRSTLPSWLGPVNVFNPLAHATDALRGTIGALAPDVLPDTNYPLATNNLTLLLMGLAALTLGARAFHRHHTTT
ncbi:ABC transporter permease [Streptomyces chrestomyceticus]|uniref:ABC transporter permease n=1 Tax=Streptomyces chrestomyceticus TaxID=68185 RepID=UPI0035A9006F